MAMGNSLTVGCVHLCWEEDTCSFATMGKGIGWDANTAKSVNGKTKSLFYGPIFLH